MLCQEKKEKKQDMAIRVRADLGSEYVSQNLRFGRWENFSYRYAPQSKNLNISTIFQWSNIYPTWKRLTEGALRRCATQNIVCMLNEMENHFLR